jgi:hypothetical protein
MECYDKRAARSVTPTARMIDYAVVFSGLYPIAAYKFVHGEFTIGSNVIFFPSS